MIRLSPVILGTVLLAGAIVHAQEVPKCEDAAYLNRTMTMAGEQLTANCDMFGIVCMPKCKEVVLQIRHDDCLGNKDVVHSLKQYTEFYTGMDYFWRGFESCDAELEGSTPPNYGPKCDDIETYMNQSLEGIGKQMTENNCDSSGATCNPACKELIEQIRQDDGCLGNAGMIALMKIYTAAVPMMDFFWRAYHSCDGELGKLETLGNLPVSSPRCEDLWTYMNQSLTGISERITTDSCDVMGETCNPKCKEMLIEIKRDDGCLGNSGMVAVMKIYLSTYPDVAYFWKAFESCDAEIATDMSIIDPQCQNPTYMDDKMKLFSQNVMENCDVFNIICLPKCKELISRTKSEDVCLGNKDVVKSLKTFTENTPGMNFFWQAFRSCDAELLNGDNTTSDGPMCDFMAFMSSGEMMGIGQKLNSTCDESGATCNPNCKEYIAQIRREDGCLGNAGMIALMKVVTATIPMMDSFWRSYHSCDGELGKLESLGNLPVSAPRCEDLWTYMNQSLKSIGERITTDSCDVTGIKCNPKCKDMIKEIKRDDGCLGNSDLVNVMKIVA
ncbi:unnamed protein product, partial [Owenia fusiformis]